MARANTYIQLVSAHVGSDGVTIDVLRAELVCGGPDDSHYETSGQLLHAHVPSTARVEVVVARTDGIGEESIAPGDLPDIVRTAPFKPIVFRETMDADGSIVELQQQYHP